MPARLSSLLVRDGLVGVKRMEKAFQRQVIYGGSLDTILLEMNLIPEDRLTQYLALASGLPPAGRDEAASLSSDALALLTSDLSQQFRALPLSLDGEALRVLVCSPLEISELEDLADLLDRPLQPLITPEYRWHLAFAKAYRGEAPARFSTLARSLSVEQAPPAVGRAKSVIIDEPARDPDATAPLVAPPRPPTFGVRNDPTEKIDFKPPIAVASAKDLPTDRLISYAPPPHLDPTRASGTYTPQQVARPTPPPPPTPAPKPPEPPARPTPPPSTTPEGLRRPAPPQFLSSPPPHVEEVRVAQTKTLMGLTPPAVPVPVEIGTGIRPRAPAVPSVPPASVPQPSQSPPATPSTGVPRPMDGRGSSGQGAGARPVMARTSIEPIATAGRDSPLAVVRARELLATAEDRDTVFLTLLRAARARARYVGLLTVQGGAAIGRLALAETGIDIAAMNTVLIPLDAMSPFRTVTQNHQPHIGPLSSGDPAVDAMVTRMGGSLPPSALLLPIVLRERVVAIVVAHRVHSDLKLVDVTELLPLAAGAADALGRLIVKHKSAGYRAPEAVSSPSIDISTSTIDTKKIVKNDSAWSAAPERRSVPVIPIPAEPVEPPKPIAQLVDTIESATEGDADAAIAEAIERSQEALGELAKRFPGTLRVDRFAVPGRPLRAAQYGGLLELTVRLGSAAGEVLIDRMASPQRDVRFYATVCASELRPRNAVFALVERLFDQDFGVRGMAIEALAGYPAADLAHALPRARRALHSSDPETVAAATAALIQLQDTDSIDDLIGAVERGDRASEHARKALVALTAQDFGLSERKWRKWYDTARRKHRIEWLIEGLAHKDDPIREAAINDLRRLTGEYFGYHHDLPKKEREVAAERWSAWWRETGLRRFVTREDERNRPTGVLPVRRD